VKTTIWALAGVLATGIAGAGGAETFMASRSYQCDRGVMVRASYITTQTDNLAIVTADGWDQMVLINVPAASGARYVAPDGDAVKELWRAPYVWWTKGVEASLYHVDMDGQEIKLLDCLEAP
jgi:membrane-bound inhibitor of C-type lysozyme